MELIDNQFHVYVRIFQKTNLCSICQPLNLMMVDSISWISSGQPLCVYDQILTVKCQSAVEQLRDFLNVSSQCHATLYF